MIDIIINVFLLGSVSALFFVYRAQNKEIKLLKNLIHLTARNPMKARRMVKEKLRGGD